MRQHRFDHGVSDEELRHRLWFASGDEKVDIADGFLSPPVTAANADTGDFGMGAQFFQQLLGVHGDVAEAESSCVFPAGFDRKQNIVRRLLSEPRQRRNSPVFAALLESLKRRNAKLIPQRLDLLRSDTLTLEQRKKPRRKLRF